MRLHHLLHKWPSEVWFGKGISVMNEVMQELLAVQPEYFKALDKVKALNSV